MPPPPGDEFAQYVRKPAAAPSAKEDEFAQFARAPQTDQKMAPGSFQTHPGGAIQTEKDIPRLTSPRNPRTGMPMGEVPGTGVGIIKPTLMGVGAAVGGPVGAGVGGGIGGAIEHKLEPIAGEPQTHGSYTGAVTGGAALGMGMEAGGELISGAVAKGWGFAKNLINKAASALSDAEGAVTGAVESQAAKQSENLATFKEKATTAIQNRDQQALLASRKEALEKGAQELQPRLQQHVAEVHDAVLNDLNQQWDVVRQGVKNITANPNTISTSLAKSNKLVSAPNIDLFNKVVGDAMGEANPARMGWADIQALYTNLGNRLAKGGLPGDVWRGLSAYQDGVGDEMETMANAGGVKKELVAVKKGWGRYMNDFKNTRVAVAKGGSPLAHSLQASDPGAAVQHFEGDAGDRATQTLAKYKKYGARPELAQKYRNVVEMASEAPAGGKDVKMPKLKQEPGVDTESIRKEAIRKGKRRLAIGALGAAGAGVAGGIGYDIYQNKGTSAPLP
jgi:hypothetical protein